MPGALATKAPFLAHNQRLVTEIAALEHKARRQDVLVDEETIAAFYDARVAPQVHSLAGFEHWRADAERSDPRLLFMTREALMRHDAGNITQEWFPDALSFDGTRLPLKYRFAPGHPLDGLTLTVPLALLNQIDVARLTWLVPGMLREKVTFLLKALPKAWRNRLIPITDVVTAFLDRPADARMPLTEALRAFIKERLGEAPPTDVWDGVTLPAHLSMNLRVVDDAGTELATGRDVAALRVQLGEAAQLSFAESGPAIERRGLRSWDFGDLPETIARRKGGQRLTGYPALADEGDSVAIVLLDTAEAAQASTRAGVVRLLRIALKDQLLRYEKGPPGFAATALTFKAAIPSDRLLADVLAAVCDRAFVGDDALPRSEAAFAEQVRRARTRLPAVADSAFRLLAEIAAAYVALNQRLGALPGSLARLGAEVRARRDALVHPGFFGATPWAQLAHLPRYLRAQERRLAKFPENPVRDARHGAAMAEWWQRYRERVEKDRAAGRDEPGCRPSGGCSRSWRYPSSRRNSGPHSRCP